jgi:predicted CxxxxCH...CXXCH cytochrome family protein
LLAFAAACSQGSNKGAPGDSGVDRTATKGKFGVYYVVAVSRPVGGTIASADGQINCGTQGGGANECAPAVYAWDEKASLTVTPDSKFFFQSWAGDCSDVGECKFDMTADPGADRWVVAVFNDIEQLGHTRWTDPAKHGQAFFRYLAGAADAPRCQRCHGSDFQGVANAPSCNACHAAAGWANWQTNCSFCHGDRTQKAGYAGGANPLPSAPPDDVAGRLSGTNGSATGAHAIHLQGSSLASPFACGQCHVVPVAPAVHGVGDIRLTALHVNGNVALAFGSLAGGAAATWNATQHRCSTYCHGSTLDGGGVKTPTWTQSDGTATACNACHGAPPPSPHPSGTQCGVCHPGYTSTSVVATTHVNGVLDVIGQGCGTCHLIPPALIGVLVSRADHTTPAHPAGSACGNCHPGYTAATIVDGTHVNGIVEVALTVASCSACHGVPPAAPHPPISDCNKCHPGYSAATGTVVTATHMNGVRDVVPMTCTTCHGSGSPAVLANAAPPDSVQGLSATTDPAVGAHRAHLAGVTVAGYALSGKLACANCHVVPNTATPDDLSHVGGGRGTVLAAVAYDTSAGTCATYCHGSTLDGGVRKTPKWTQLLSGASCDACHGFPPRTRGHAGLPAGDGTTCVRCHHGSVDGAGNIKVVGDASLHVNGTVEEDVSAGGGDCASCHTNLSMGANATTYHHVTGGCAGCHADHDVFTAARGFNLLPVTLGVGSNVDTGACTACHQSVQAKDFTKQKDDGTRQTYAIDPAAYTAGGHSYLVGGSISGVGASYDFQVGCAKCHDSTAASVYQDGTYSFGLHESTDRRLRAALGRLGVGDDVAEDFCYRCHSNAGDAVGGARKGSDLVDWYGATSMPPGSTGVFTQMAGTPPASQTSTDTLFFKPSAQEGVTGTSPTGPSAEPDAVATSALYLNPAAATTPPAGYQLSGGPYDTSTLRQYSMTVPSSASATSVTVNTTAASGVRYDKVAQFLSPPVATAFTWSSGNIALYFSRVESNGNNNCYLRYAAYRWTPGTGTATQIVNAANNATEFSTTAGGANFNMALASAVTFAVGDQLLVELEVYKNGPTSTGTCSFSFGNTASDATRVVLPATSAGSFPDFLATAPALGGSWNLRSMSPFTPTVASETITGTGTTSAYATQLWQRASFVSPAVTVATTLPASAWALSVSANRGSLSSNTGYLRYRIYRWNAAGAQGPDIVAWRTHGTTLSSGTTTVAITTPVGAATTLSVGDKVVVELEIETMNTTTAVAANPAIVFGSANGSSVTMPAKVTFSYLTPAVVPSVGHLGGLYTGIHRPNPAEETLARIAAAKHVECSDCHDPHQARRGNQADGGTAASATSATLTDVSQKWLADAWKGFYVDIVSGTGAGGRAQITGNSETQLNFATLGTAPAGGSVYRISMRGNGGVASTSTSSTLTDSQSAVGGAKAWQPNAFAGWYVRIVLGTGMNQPAKLIASNTATQLTLSGTWTITPDTTSRYVVDKLPGVLAGAGGVNVTAWDAGTPTAWNEAKTLSPAPGSATAIPDATTQWQVCFKCHSAANTAVTSWKAGWTDLAAEFNPRNQSYHPVVAPAGAFAATGYGNTALTATQLTNGWKPGDMMYCSDCHGNADTGYGAAQGPHASAVPFVLRGPNTRWPTMADGTTRWTVNSSGTGLGTKDGLFCRNCHPALTGVHTSRSNHQSTACTGCHIQIPHGGKVKRLIRTTNTPPPYADTGATAQMRSYAGGTAETGSCGVSCTDKHSLTATSTNSW